MLKSIFNKCKWISSGTASTLAGLSILFLLSAACALAIGYAAQNPASQPATQLASTDRKKVKYGQIKIATNPGGFPLSIDGIGEGETSTTVHVIELAAGNHNVEILLPNGERWVRDINIARAQTVCISLNYRPQENTETKPGCSYSLSISAPGNVSARELITFTSEVTNGSPASLKYTWTVVPANTPIISGAGTPTITVDTTGLVNTQVTAALTVDNSSGDATCHRSVQAFTQVYSRKPPGLISRNGSVRSQSVQGFADKDLDGTMAGCGEISAVGVGWEPPKQRKPRPVSPAQSTANTNRDLRPNLDTRAQAGDPNSNRNTNSSFYGNLKDNANVVFTTPESMKMEETKVIELLVSPSESVEKLTAALSEPGSSGSGSTKYADRMEAQLAGTGFTITPIGPAIQPVEVNQTTKWMWQIKPKDGGVQRLDLTLNAVLNDGKDRGMVQTFHRDIHINVGWTQRASGFISTLKDFQWLWAVIIVPVAGAIYAWFRKRKARRKK